MQDNEIYKVIVTMYTGSGIDKLTEETQYKVQKYTQKFDI